MLCREVDDILFGLRAAVSSPAAVDDVCPHPGCILNPLVAREDVGRAIGGASVVVSRDFHWQNSALRCNGSNTDAVICDRSNDSGDVGTVSVVGAGRRWIVVPLRCARIIRRVVGPNEIPSMPIINVTIVVIIRIGGSRLYPITSAPKDSSHNANHPPLNPV